MLGSRGGHRRWAPLAGSAGGATWLQSGQVRQKEITGDIFEIVNGYHRHPEAASEGTCFDLEPRK